MKVLVSTYKEMSGRCVFLLLKQVCFLLNILQFDFIFLIGYAVIYTGFRIFDECYCRVLNDPLSWRRFERG